MVCVSRNAREIIFIEYHERINIEKGTAIGEKFLFHHDEVPGYLLMAAAAEIQLMFKLISYPLHLPDLPPNGYTLFPNLKNNTEAVNGVNENFDTREVVFQYLLISTYNKYYL